METTQGISKDVSKIRVNGYNQFTFQQSDVASFLKIVALQHFVMNGRMAQGWQTLDSEINPESVV